MSSDQLGQSVWVMLRASNEVSILHSENDRGGQGTLGPMQTTEHVRCPASHYWKGIFSSMLLCCPISPLSLSSLTCLNAVGNILEQSFPHDMVSSIQDDEAPAKKHFLVLYKSPDAKNCVSPHSPRHVLFRI